ncbi:unnamed protein product [Paramecium pentaurelia]|uniref:Uncharacterized protein n=1 Tax=Paramecium pentaurelia TaxID=43138 RepID=A0A8S1W6W3_9CILI|nr:unnamed protein product [Paramecium pentaurelia]
MRFSLALKENNISINLGTLRKYGLKIFDQFKISKNSRENGIYIKLPETDEKLLSKGQYSRNYFLILKGNIHQGKTQQKTMKQQIMINLCYLIIKIKKKLNFNKMFQSMVTQIKLIRKEIKMVHKTIVQKIKTKNLSDDLRLFLTTLNIMENLN